MSEKRPHLKLKEHKPPENRVYEGGGGGTYPRESYSRHANKIYKEAQTLQKIFDESTKNEDVKRKYLRFELPEGTNLWGSDAGKVEENMHARLVGTPRKNIGHFSTIDDSFKSLTEQLETYSNTEKHVGKSKFAAIESIEKIPAEEKISESLISLLRENEYKGEALVTLFPDLTNEENQTLAKAIDIYLKENNGEVINKVDTDFGQVLRIKAGPNEIHKLADFFMSVQTVDPIEEALVESATDGEPIEDTVVIDNNSSKAKVCIFDNGVVQGSRFIDDSVIAHEEPIGPPYDVSHGTFVASRIIYGSDLRDQVSIGKLNPDVKILSVCMCSHDEIGNRKPAGGEQFLIILRDTVARWHREIKVYNLSMNLVSQGTLLASTVTDDHVGAIAAEIDKLCKEYDVLFVITTGNYPISSSVPNPATPYPEYFQNEDTRLCHPGEAMLALTVGSVADRENKGSMASVGNPSPFTRKGPGFNGYRKPDLVMPGGNYANGWKRFDDLSVAGINVTGSNLAYGNGTSYAAPLISRLAAKIFENIPDASQVLVRALLIHSSNYLNTDGFDEDLYHDLIGNGLPETDHILWSSKWKQNYIFTGAIQYRQILRIPFYVPKVLTGRGGRNKLRIKVTIAFSPETNRTLKAGYCKSHMRVNLFKLNEKSELKKVAADNSSREVLKERYSTIIRYDKVFSSGVNPGEWELLIEQESKWNTGNTDTPYAVIITIVDPREDDDIDIYNAIQTETNNKYENFIEVREQIKV